MKSLYESLLDDFDKMSDFQDIELILDDPNFNKTNFNKLKRLFKKAGAGEDYTNQDKNNTETMFIGYKRGGLNNTSEVMIGIPGDDKTLKRLYCPGYRYVHDLDDRSIIPPSAWGVLYKFSTSNFFSTKASSNEVISISIPEYYAQYFKALLQTAPEYYSKEWTKQTDAKKPWKNKNL